jgi:hypothetical protein
MARMPEQERPRAVPSAMAAAGDRPPGKRPILQEFNGGADGPGLTVWRPFDGAVLWIPFP